MSQESSSSEHAGAPTLPVVKVDDSSATAVYANFCRVTGAPEELVIDFGMNLQQRPTDDVPVKITQRAVLNYYTAKRLLQALSLSVSRHEQAFGVLETNVHKRLEKR